MSKKNANKKTPTQTELIPPAENQPQEPQEPNQPQEPQEPNQPQEPKEPNQPASQQFNKDGSPKKDGRGRPRKSDSEARNKLLPPDTPATGNKASTEPQTSQQSQPASTGKPQKVYVPVSGNFLCQMVDAAGVTILPPVIKAARKDSKITAENMALTPEEKTMLTSACNEVAPFLKIGPWEMFFVAIASIYGKKIMENI